MEWPVGALRQTTELGDAGTADQVLDCALATRERLAATLKKARTLLREGLHDTKDMLLPVLGPYELLLMDGAEIVVQLDRTIQVLQELKLRKGLGEG